MPTYSYRCRDCNVAFDIQQSFNEDSLTVCPECNGALRKLFNTVGVVFKGSGFYRTDSRAAGDSRSASPAATSSSDSSGGGSSSSGSSTSGASGSGSGSGSTAGSSSSSGSSTSSSS
ncbi:FmdB family zinc ribbon protein [Dietzia sp. ANT_WB102]|uniref:FmdB family zinc ribbon protein n=1 Tax=Dietzia sp. ANT_WB102 TaxID=2597345 RepID=UPI0011EDF900|nr:FmdB family zinc ribbon protein [Dietzia sp. ANT_WB102]KAA0919192.1 FmdB family transcriptional regulator [Dietzia sp. ANT_WB102]